MTHYDEISFDFLEFNLIYELYGVNRSFYTSIKTFVQDLLFKNRHNLLNYLFLMNANNFDFDDMAYIFKSQNGTMVKQNKINNYSMLNLERRTRKKLIEIFIDNIQSFKEDPEMMKVLSLKDKNSLLMKSIKLYMVFIQKKFKNLNENRKFLDITMFINKFRGVDFSDKPELKSLLNGPICVF